MTTTITSEHNTTATSSTGTTSSVAGQPLLDGSVTGSGGASVGSNNPSEHPSSQHPQPSILQLAAASLASTETDLVDIRRSQRLREEIDRLKSSIPMAAAPSGAILAPTPMKQATTKMPPQGSTKTNRVTSNSTYQQQKRSRKRSSTSLKAKSSVAPPASVPASVPVRRTGGPVTVTSRQHELAPLASLDYSITTDTSGSLVAPANGANNGSTMAADTKRQVTAAANLTSSASSSTIDTPTLSGYFDCDELSDMLDDSLFEITNAGCLSRSVFNRGEVKELPPNGLPAGANQNGQHDNSQVVGELEQLEDGDRTPTNQPKRPMTTSSSQPNFKRPNQAPPLSAGGPHVRAVGQQQQQQPQLTTPIVASQQQKQVYRPEMIRGQDYSSTSSVPNHVKASLASNQVNSIHGKQSSHQAHRQQHQQTQPPPATGHSLSSSANYLQRRRRSKTTTLTTNQTQRGPNEYEDEQEEDEETAAADGSSGDLTEPAPVAGLGKLSTTKQQPPSSSQPAVATKRRSQSNSMLGTGPPAKGSDYQQDINRRCPICCQTEGGNGSGHGSGKKASSGKRRFTFSLFNLFSGNSQQQPQKSNDDDHNQIATCHHHKFAPSSSSRQPIMTGNGGGSGSGSYATSSRKTPQASSTNGASTTRRRHHGAKAGITNPISNSSGQSTASARNNGRTGDQCPLPPIRLRDSIKITNQRKQRQNNRSATGKAPNEWSPGEPVAQSTQADEVLLDLSGPTSSRMNNTSRPRQSHQPALAGGSGVTALATTPRNKCVKFTTPDRVMFLSPEPPIEREHRVSASISSERLSRMVPNSGSNANNITRHLTSSQSSSQLGTVSAGSLLLDSQPPAPIIKWPAASTPAVASSSSVPKSSSYSQTEPNKGVEELLAKYEQNNKLVAEINEKLHLTETISSNKTALDGSMSQEGDDGEDEYEHAGSDGFVGEEQQLEQPVCLPPSGELLIGTGCDQHQSPDLATVHFETEEVDEDLLAAIQERLDELDVAATNESAIIMAEAPEDFSHCDCNDSNQNNNQNSNSSGRLQQRTGAVGPPGSTTVTVRQGNVDEISSSGAIHQPDVIGVARAEAGLGDRDGDDKPPSTSDINGRRLTSQQRQANGPRRRPPEGGKGEKGAELGVQSEEPPATAPDEDEKTEYLHNLTGGPTRAFV